MSFLLQSCAHINEEYWDNALTAKRHFSRGIRALCGNVSDSRQVRCKEEFYQHEYETYEDVIPLQNESLEQIIENDETQVPQANTLT